MYVTGLLEAQNNQIVKELTIDDAVRIALEKNLTLQQTAIDLGGRKRASDRSWNSLIPSIGAGAMVSHPTSITDSLPQGQDSWTPGFQVSASLTLSVSIIDNIKKAKSDYEVGVIGYEQARQELEIQVRKLFYQIILLNANRELAALSLENAQARYEQSVSLARVGQATRLDEMSARVDMENKKPALRNAQTAYENVMDSFKALLGMPVKIKSQFYLLVAGIIILPVLAFTVNSIYMRYISTYGKYREEFEELLRLRELAGLPAPPIFPRLVPFLFLIIVILFVIIVSLIIARSITRSVALLEDSTRRIANGELELAVDIKGSNEITSLTNSLNIMRNSLKEEERKRYLFIMGITHDLKTPLALIKANVEAIEDGIADNPDDQKHSLHIINNKVDELEGMINNLLDFVKMDSAEAEKNVQMTNLKSFLSSFIERITIDAELLRHKVEANVNLPDSLVVKMDSLLIQRALDNIVNNFIRYTQDGSCLFINAEFSAGQIKLTISDNGNGINQKDLPYIFDLFYRGSASRGEQGMGMGLAVAKSIFDSHGWSISATAEKDKGSCFTIIIPKAEAL
ncbi:ATP-binding protein [Treponema sp. R80B11-R83G3]